MPTLRIRSLTKVYPNLFRALDDVSLTMGQGVLGLLGPNGAGKSTLLSILCGQLCPEAGEARLDETDVERNPTDWRRRLGFMPQSFDFVPHLTGREYLEECAVLSGWHTRDLRDRIEELLGRVGLAEAANRFCSQYSRGMKQRLAVAGAFLCEPDLVLLDEPTSGLDPVERVLFRDLLAEEGAGRVVILSTHIVTDIERCCDVVAVIYRGRLLFVGSPQNLVARAQGKVWEKEASETHVSELAGDRSLVRVFERDGATWARLFSADRPDATAHPVEGNLEDAYVALLREISSGETLGEDR